MLTTAGASAFAQGNIATHQCAKGQTANDYPNWEFIANNPVRISDDYAIDRNPSATFILGQASPVLQFGGQYAGQYLVMVKAEAPSGTAFAMLKPNFDF